MKNLHFERKLLFTGLFVLFCLFSGQTFAQVQTDGDGESMKELPAPFEGTIRYNIRLSGKYSADIQLSEPANRMDMHFKEDNFIVHLYGGQRPKTFLFLGDSNHTYIIDAANRRIFQKDYYIDTTSTIPLAVAIGKTEFVKKHECEIYKVEKPGKTIYYYVSEKFRVNLAEFAGKDEAKASFLTEGLNGRIPLRTIIKEQGLTTEIDLDFVRKSELEPENFQLPEGFKMKGRDPRG